ncbi:MAG: HIT domain-containing protein [Nanoarchaeota archaeon]
MDNCVFCKIVGGKIKSEKIGESDNFIAIKDAHPAVEGHTLIIPKKHMVTLLDIPNKLGNELLEFEKKIAGKLMEDKKGDGFNIIMNNLSCAGQVVMHAHIHVIPRKEEDGIRFFTKK